jgi:hypothetical protein
MHMPQPNPRCHALGTTLCIVLLFWAAHNMSAQTEEEMSVQASPANIRSWLDSKDPRLIAWAASFALKNKEMEVLELAGQKLTDSLRVGSLDLLSPYGADCQEVAVVLDALIQGNVNLPVESLRNLMRAFPAQAAILASRLPPTEANLLLMEWYRAGRVGRSTDMSRIAAMLLSKSPPPGFAATILADSEEKLSIAVVAPNAGGGLSGSSVGGMCGDGGGGVRDRKWPVMYVYSLEENNRSSDPLLVEAGGDRITWRRIDPSKGWGSCYGVKPLTAATRHHLVAEMLGVSVDGMPWPVSKNITIVWQSTDQFQRELGAAVEAENAKLHETESSFRAKGLITTKEGDVTPNLVVAIHYDPDIKPPE